MKITDLKELGSFNGTIHCRVICKRPMRKFNQGHILSVDLTDESGEIRAVAFNNEATRMDQLLGVDQVYWIGKFLLQTKRRQHSQSPHDLEILFEPRSVVIPIPDDGSLPRKKYHFVELRSVLGLELKSFVDVIGVVLFTGELEEYMHEDDGQTSDMRFVTLVDQSGFTIKARLWDHLARDFDGSNHPVLAFGSIVISPPTNKHGPSRFLDTKVQTSILPENPNFPETRTLRKWFSANKDDLLTEDSRMDDSNIPSSSSGVEDIRRSIKDALKKGAVKVKIVKLVFLGPPEVGKTQLKRALLGDFRKVQESTDVSTQAAPAVEVLLTGTAHKKWELLDFSHLNKLSMDKNSWSDKQWSSSPDTYGQPPVTHRSTSEDSQVTSSSQSPIRSAKPSVAVEKDTFESRSKHFENINSYVLTSITKAEAKRGSKEPLEFKLVYIIDNGGQPSFLDFHSATATFAASYVLLFDARGKGLDAFPEMTLRKLKTEFPIRNMPPSIYSNFDLLRRSLMTVHHFSRRFNQKHEMITSLMKNAFLPAKSPHVLIVGTHKDFSLEPKRFADKARLDSTCESIPSLKHQYDIRFVDSTNEQCEEELSDIRKTLSLKDNVCKFDLPLSWFQVYLLSLNVGSDENLQAQKYDDLYKMCLEQNHVKSPEEFRAMTTVLHSLGVFYIAELEQPSLFKGDFNDVLIFVDPNLLFHYLSRILAIPFREPSSISCRVLRELQNLGELTPDCLVELDIPDTLGTLPGFHNKLLGWLVNWRLAANLQKDGEERLFIPSVLPPRPKASPPFIPSGRFKNVFPLYFTFQPEDTTNNRSFHYLPAGFFPHLVVHLMQSGRFFLRENSTNNQTEYPYRCRDSIVLSEGGRLQKSTLYICLVDESDRLAVYMWPAYQPRSSQTDQSPASPDLLLCHAGEVLADLKSCMIQTNERLFYTPIDNCVIALCSACPCEPSPPQTSSQAVQPAALIHLAKVVGGEACLQCLSHSGFGAPIFDIDVILVEVLHGFSGQTQDSAITRKRGVGERSQSEPSPSKTKVPQTRRNATDPSQAERLRGQECAQDPIKSISDFLPYFEEMLPQMRMLGVVLNIDSYVSAVIQGSQSQHDKCLDILKRWIATTTEPTWTLLCKNLKKHPIFTSLVAKIERNHRPDCAD